MVDCIKVKITTNAIVGISAGKSPPYLYYVSNRIVPSEPLLNPNQIAA